MDKTTNSKVVQRVAALREQVDAAMAAADALQDENKPLLRAAAQTVAGVVQRELRKLKQGPILELPENASDKELKEARVRRAVRRGESLYLPSWKDMAVGFPNVLLRSALFAACNSGEPLFEQAIATQGDATLKMTGPQLGHYDRQVFAACLRYYRDGLTLHAANTSLGWIKVSFWQLAQDLNVPYGLNGHIAIRESLIRLNAAHLRIRTKRQDIPLPRLIEVAFEDGYEGRATASQNLKGSDTVAFRVLDAMAELFGPDDWSNVSDAAIFDYSGLTAWATSFFSTHKDDFALKIKDLYDYSGSVCELREFRRRLKETLTKLQSPETDEQVRVERFEMNKEYVRVYLMRWQKTKNAAAIS